MSALTNAGLGPVDDPARLREAQAAAYEAEDFPRFFALTRRLAETSPAFAASYEYHAHATLHALARHRPDPFFLQVGGMDGKRFDPVFAFTRHYRWRGLILEPLPDLFAALGANYAGARDRVTLVNAALTDADGERDIVRVRRDAAHAGAVPAWAEGLASFFPERNALGGVGVPPELLATLRGHATTERVACLTLRTLLERHPVPRLDLLQVDAEGCELLILRQLDWSAHRPAVVQLEHWALPLPERAELLAILAGQGYVVRMGRSDVLALEPAFHAACGEEAGYDW